MKIDQTATAKSIPSAPGTGAALPVAIIAALVITGLYVGREIFVPIALAILLSFVLAPPVDLLERWRLPRAVAVPLVVVVAFLVLFGLGSLIATQITQLAEKLPTYQQTMRQKISSLKSATTAGPLERAAQVLQSLGKELNKPENNAEKETDVSLAPAPEQQTHPIPVEVRSPPPTALENVSSLIAPLLHPLATVGVVVIFVVFILFQREDLRNRLIKLAGSNDLQKATSAIDDAASRLSRLFLSQLGLNAAFGLVIGLGLWMIGVPSAILWGILAGIMRFVPYIGAFVAAFFPLTLAIAVDPGWSMLAWTAALILITELLVGHAIEPMLFGHSSGLSPFAVVVSATFWTALWGPIGLVVATPLTVCLVVLGRHVERLKFFDILLGDRPALSPPEIFYQRMLADDPGEAVEKAEEYLKERTLSDYYEKVALKGLKLAHDDMKRDRLPITRLAEIRDSVVELIDDLADQDDDARDGDSNDTETEAAINASIVPMPELPFLIREGLPPEWQAEQPVLCVAERSDLDEAAALILAQILSKHGLGARVAKKEDVSSAGIFRLDGEGVALVCVSALDDASPAYTRHVVRKLRRKIPQAKILVCHWMAENDAVTKNAGKADAIATSLSAAAQYCLNLAQPAQPKEGDGILPLRDAALRVVG
ncbi:AI-2E family transporter [Bradyrhizobium sp. G127]|uniref:AI-2E family transporter n=1 Tax=Bradyrhizobium sp. G127 TaxID=2904800 RepID=UPI001F1D8DAF|nr:AI-2E family transporter [Bradyrhizobium sp. G127]